MDNYLTIISEPKRGGGGLGKLVNAKCICGSIKEYRLRFIKSNHTTSCGCKITIHGYHKHPLFKVWQSMRERCFNDKHKGYEYYGGRGISICDEWKNDAKTFIEWCLKNGWNQGLQIDRINNDLDYSPDNCRCVTPKDNMRNRRNTVKIIYKDQSKSLTEWAEIFKIPIFTLRQRIKRGYTAHQALTKPVDKKKLLHC